VNPFVDLFLEFVFVDEAVDLQGAEEVAEPLPTLRWGISCRRAKRKFLMNNKSRVSNLGFI
jgi:hypothetical protein